MNILGLGGSNHDFSACLVQDGNIMNMIEDERITRVKHSRGLGVEIAKGFSRKYCLEQMSLSLSEIDMFISNDIIHKGMLHRLNDVKLINHHMAHAASSFYCSPFQESAILVVDSVGSKIIKNNMALYESVTLAYGEDNHINAIQKCLGKNLDNTDYIENSLGIFYSIITDVVGFKELQEGKTMGLAPYGSDKWYNQIKSYIRYTDNGHIIMSQKDIYQLLDLKKYVNSIDDSDIKFALAADIAWAAQQILEEIMIELCKYLKSLTKSKNLCLSGGVALNSVANYKIYKEKIFDNIFIQPAAGDNGTSIGAALYGYYELLNNKRQV